MTSFHFCRELVALLATYLRSGLKLVVAKLWKNDGKKVSRWSGGSKESRCLIPAIQSKKMLMSEGTGFQCV